MTLQESWIGTVDGYPIRVEEHRSDLAYVVEFYDSLEQYGQSCITHSPESGRELDVKTLQRMETPMPS